MTRSKVYQYNKVYRAPLAFRFCATHGKYKVQNPGYIYILKVCILVTLICKIINALGTLLQVRPENFQVGDDHLKSHF